MTQHGCQLGMMMMAQNPVAHDAVCARILNLNPWEINHLRLAHERACGPLDVKNIDLKGDISLKEIQTKTRGWDTGYIKVDKADCALQILCGRPYCIGGCHGAFLDWLYMIKDRYFFPSFSLGPHTGCLFISVYFLVPKNFKRKV